MAKHKKLPLLYFDRVAYINDLSASGYTLEDARASADAMKRWLGRVLHKGRAERRYSRRAKGYTSR